jgi:hypothetical protein
MGKVDQPPQRDGAAQPHGVAGASQRRYAATKLHERLAMPAQHPQRRRQPEPDPGGGDPRRPRNRSPEHGQSGRRLPGLDQRHAESGQRVTLAVRDAAPPAERRRAPQMTQSRVGVAEIPLEQAEHL